MLSLRQVSRFAGQGETGYITGVEECWHCIILSPLSYQWLATLQTNHQHLLTKQYFGAGTITRFANKWTTILITDYTFWSFK